jgi:hypothetical protein
MRDNTKKIVSMLVFVAALLAVRYAFDAYREHAAMNEASNTLEQIKSDAAREHPELPASVAMQQEAVAMTSERLDNESDAEKKLTLAAGNFFGFYLINVRERADYCRNNGVDIAPFVSTFQMLHVVELERARDIIAGTDATEEKIYTVIQPQLGPLIEQDMHDIAKHYNLTIKEACELFVTKGDVIANNMQLSKIQPAVYQVLMGN